MSPKFFQSKRQVQKIMDVLWNSKLGNKNCEQEKSHFDLVSVVVSDFFPLLCFY